ncbi:MAG: LysM peptidoglycan-binding domain-containing protein [Desulfatiglandales bacterium]
MHVKNIAGQIANLFAGLTTSDFRCAMWVSHIPYPISHISKKGILILLTFLVAFPYLLAHAVQGKGRDTFSISLVQQVTVKRIGGKKVICERYRVKKGDYIWQLLRQRGLLKRPDLVELISLLKGMNSSLTNLDLIHPGQTILIPINIIPVSAYAEGEGLFKASITGISALKDVDFEDYVVKTGDSLTMVAHNRYNIPGEHLYREYLELVQKLNPTLKDLDLIYPNQVIRLPIYSPEMVRMPIRPKKVVKRALKKTKITPAEETGQGLSLREKLRDIFKQMGEEWIDTGEQFIPLKSGAQIRLKAGSFPVLNLTNGRRLIIDIKNELPEDISQLIESDWEDYRIVHLAPDDNLKAVMDKILAASDYYKILKSGEQFKIGGDVDISIAGDWVIIPHRGERDVTDKIAVISLINNQSEKTPAMVRTYLEKLGIRIIDYPDFPHEDMKEGVPIQKKIEAEKDIDFPLASLLLDLAGQPFSRQVNIPVYQGESPKFNLIIQADLFFNRKDKDCIIDLTGLSPAILSLLKRHHFLVLSLAGKQGPNRMTELILDFLGLPFDSKPHHLLTAARDETRGIKLTIPGISFHDQEGKKVLAIDTKMPVEIVSFLNQKGYNILELGQFQDQDQTRDG